MPVIHAKQFVLVRQLRLSDFGWFAALRERIDLKGRQRALNLNARIAKQILPPREFSSGGIKVRAACVHPEARDIRERPIKKEQKNWRLCGAAVPGAVFAAIEPGDLFVGHIDFDTTPLPYLEWSVVIRAKTPEEHAAISAVCGTFHDSMSLFVPEARPFAKLVSYLKGPPLATKTVNFQPRARLLRMLGEELIPDEKVAVVELVKNAWDADASEVSVTLETSSGPRIIVEDNGHGMSFDALSSVWMAPGTADKRGRLPPTTPSGRPLLGRKGVGRFAADKLARTLDIRTKLEGEPTASTVTFEWDRFDDDSKRLDELPFVISQVAADPTTRGTTLTMTGLRTDWDEARVTELRRDLLGLQSPFAIGRGDFNVKLKINGREEQLAATRDKVLDLATVKVTATYVEGERKVLTTTVEGGGRTNTTHMTDLPMFQDVQIGPFTMTLHAWLLDPGTAKALGEVLSLSEQRAKKRLAEWSGVSIYRDGFRVFPYGQPGHDWLKLDKRRINDPSYFLGSTQVIGAVQITQCDNPLLKDQTNRVGLIDNDTFRLLKVVVMEVIKRSEELLTDLRKQRSETGVTPRTHGEAIRKLEAAVARDDTAPDPKELRQLVAEVAQEDAALRREVFEEVARYRRMLSLGALAAKMVHEVNNQLDIVRSELVTANNYLSRPTPVVEQVRVSIASADSATRTAARQVTELLPFARARRKEEVFVVRDVLQRVIDQHRARAEHQGVAISLIADESRVRADFAEMSTVFTNLLDNSLYWLKGRDAPTIQIDVATEGEVVVVHVTDNGPGVQHHDPDAIFQPFVTMKPEGMGLGLAIAGEILEDLGGKLKHGRVGVSTGCTIEVRIPLAKDPTP